MLQDAEAVIDVGQILVANANLPEGVVQFLLLVLKFLLTLTEGIFGILQIPFQLTKVVAAAMPTALVCHVLLGLKVIVEFIFDLRDMPQGGGMRRRPEEVSKLWRNFRVSPCSTSSRSSRDDEEGHFEAKA